MRKSLVVLVSAVLMLALVYRVPLVRQLFAQPHQAAPQPTAKVGDKAPDFKLKDQFGHDVSLDQFRGKKNVVLAFYVFAFTGG